jgi:hypothetical protein
LLGKAEWAGRKLSNTGNSRWLNRFPQVQALYRPEPPSAGAVRAEGQSPDPLQEVITSMISLGMPASRKVA